jgi:hypothetical protein
MVVMLTASVLIINLQYSSRQFTSMEVNLSAWPWPGATPAPHRAAWLQATTAGMP